MNTGTNNLNVKLSQKERIIHVIFPTILIFLFWFLYLSSKIKTGQDYLEWFLYSLVYVLIILLNMHFLLDRYFFKGEKLKYALITFLTIIIGYFLEQSVYNMNPIVLFEDIINKPILYLRDIVLNTIIVGMMGGIATSFMLIHIFVKTQQQFKELQNAKLIAELNNLKYQISPHFLFNTLNNLYVLSKTQSEQVPEFILTLADISRYQLYEIQKDKVFLIDEITYIENLLKLEQIRKDKLIIQKNIHILDDSILIEPLLFTPLIENAIKHGSQKVNHATISISLNASKEHINFVIINNKAQNNNTLQYNDNKSTGIENLKGRLAIVYPDNHSLTFNDSNDYFEVELSINLS